ncbi:MAG TPA: NADH-ubiquinone oxidoreductase-F iron-sulfur binding region domain-containing protein [Acidimicrobiia bacterium]|nr:NADH-ubiquinone oxidoreductase-F iron-sulfur binding region domain-containing protein [Acidimicrobiia bacterium]
MTDEWRVLPPSPFATLTAAVEAGGERGLLEAARIGPAAVVDLVAASGLRGRGGAGFPTGRKWRTVAANASEDLPTTVVVNAAEGEPGSFKDRMILRHDPYRVLEGALIAAFAVGAPRVIVALKGTFRTEIARVRAAVQEVGRYGWTDDVEIDVFEGPTEYLYGEETGLLEAIDGRAPFPRIAPPYRQGVDEVVETASDVDTESKSPAHVEMATPTHETPAPPTLVDNVETLANVPRIVADGADWFRSVGTEQSPGTLVCTVTGRTRRHGVAELPMGTPLRDVLETIGGGPLDGHEIVAVMSGVANALVPAARLDTPISYEAMAAIGSGLGTGGYIVFDDTTDLVAVAHGVARFLAVESCGQCTPCKQDGLAIAAILDKLRTSSAHPDERRDLDARLANVAFGARCNLASQQQAVVGSVLALFPDAVAGHLDGSITATGPELIAPIVDIVDGVARLDEHHQRKQPDWTFHEHDSGQSPADRLDEHRSPESEDY